MSSFILDASALLASLFAEPGHEKVDPHLDKACISSVNLAEVVAKLTMSGVPQKEIQKILNELDLQVEGFDAPRAISTGALITQTAKAGLSLGDRACLALAIELDLPALTADKAWRKTNAGARVELIR
jgi:PIN domain nuclease of toxin-antitoxin system